MANIWRFTIGGTDSSGQQEWNSTMHYQTALATGADEPSASDVLDQIIEHYGAGAAGTGMERWRATFAPPVKLRFARVYQELDPTSTDLPETADHAFLLDGSAATGTYLEPFAICPWVKFTTGIGSRSARGGTHLAPAIPSYVLTSGGLFDTTTSWWSACVSLAGYQLDVLDAVFPSTFGAGDLKPVIYSRTRRGRGETPFTFALTGATPSPVPRFLRRRDVGR